MTAISDGPRNEFFKQIYAVETSDGRHVKVNYYQ